MSLFNGWKTMKYIKIVIFQQHFCKIWNADSLIPMIECHMFLDMYFFSIIAQIN